MMPEITQVDSSSPEGQSPNTSRYGRARKQKTVRDFYPIDLVFQMKSRTSKSPTKSPRKSSSPLLASSSKTSQCNASLSPDITSSAYSTTDINSKNHNISQNRPIKNNETSNDFVMVNKKSTPDKNLIQNHQEFTGETNIPWKQQNGKPLKVYVKKDLIQKKPESHTKTSNLFQNFLLLCETTHDAELRTNNDDNKPSENYAREENKTVSNHTQADIKKRCLSLKKKPHLEGIRKVDTQPPEKFDSTQKPEALVDKTSTSDVSQSLNTFLTAKDTPQPLTTIKKKLFIDDKVSASEEHNHSSPGTDNLNGQNVVEEVSSAWSLGELLWAKIGAYPFWPCLITTDPSSQKFVVKKKIGRSSDFSEEYHVTYFGDNAKRSLVKAKNLMKFEGLDHFNTLKDQLSSEVKRKDPKYYNGFEVRENLKSKWTAGVLEAEQLISVPPLEREQLFLQSFESATSKKKTERVTKRKQQHLIDSDVSLSESMLNVFETSETGASCQVHASPVKCKDIVDIDEFFSKCLDDSDIKTEKSKVQSHMDKWLLKAKNHRITAANNANGDISAESTSQPIPKKLTNSRRKSVSNVNIDYSDKKRKRILQQRRKSIANVTSQDLQDEDVIHTKSLPCRKSLRNCNNIAEVNSISPPVNNITTPITPKSPQEDLKEFPAINSSVVSIDEEFNPPTSSPKVSNIKNEKTLASNLDNDVSSNEELILKNNMSSSEKNGDSKMATLRRRKTVDSKCLVENVAGDQAPMDVDTNEQSNLSNKSQDCQTSVANNLQTKVSDDHIPGNAKYNDPDFIEFWELKRDSLLDPDLSEESQMSYLYKIWQYGKSNETEEKRNCDDYCLVKGMSSEIISNEVKRVRKPKDDKPTASLPQEKTLRKKTTKAYFDNSDSDSEFVDSIIEIGIEEAKDSSPKLNMNDGENNKISKSYQKGNKKMKDKVEEVKDEISVSGKDLRSAYYMESLAKVKPNIFKGLVKEKVCTICEQPTGLTKCRGSCGEMFHVACVEKQRLNPTPEASEKKAKKRGRKRIHKNIADRSLLSDSNDSIGLDPIENKDNDMALSASKTIVIEAGKFEMEEKKLQEMIKTDHNESELDISSTSVETGDEWSGVNAGECVIVDVSRAKDKGTSQDSTLNGGDVAFKCNHCVKSDKPLCFVCKAEVHKESASEKRQKCNVNHCNKYYHIECLQTWPQTKYSSACLSKVHKKDTEEAFSCPRHVCHTCISDDPRNSQTRFSGDKLARCVRCPATYHCFTKCVPAGSRLLTASQIICPKHEDKGGKTQYKVNTAWCFICSKGGSLICCETCPTSFHAECLKISPPEGSYICEECETGRLPLYEELVWVKLGAYRWWPAVILHPADIPSNIAALPHASNQFAVRFFGDYDHFWVSKGRVFPYQEDDNAKSQKKSSVDSTFLLAMEQAKEAFTILKNLKNNSDGDDELAASVLPPQYVKLKVNRPVGAVLSRKNNKASAQKCDCDPASDNPCGPETTCLNRVLFTECSPDVCAAGDACSNQAFEKRLYPPLVPVRTMHRGWGLQTLADIKKGDFVIEYVGEVIDEGEFQKRMARKREIRDGNYYFLALDKDRMIDAGPKGNVARFMNHSCEPNCETQKWTVSGDKRVGLFALDDIPAGTEVTFNYNLMSADGEKKRCMCGAKRCAGYIGAKLKQEEIAPKNSKKLPTKRKYTKKNLTKGLNVTIAAKPGSRKVPMRRRLSLPEKVEKIVNLGNGDINCDDPAMCDTVHSPINISSLGSEKLLNSSSEESKKENHPIDNCLEGKSSHSPTFDKESGQKVNSECNDVEDLISSWKVEKRVRSQSVYVETTDKGTKNTGSNGRRKRYSTEHAGTDGNPKGPKPKRSRQQRSLTRCEEVEI